MSQEQHTVPQSPPPVVGGQQDLFGDKRNGGNRANGERVEGTGDLSGFRDPAFMANRHAPVHRWLPWIAGYSKHFVADALARYVAEPGVVLDPFSGVGTTLVEADLAGHEAVGFEINPYAAFASRTKLKAHRVLPEALRETALELRDFTRKALADGVPSRREPPPGFRTRAPFYSPKVQRKVLSALEFIDGLKGRKADVFRLAFAATMVDYSNYSYEPSLGRKAAVGRPDVDDFAVADALVAKVLDMAEDARWYRSARAKRRRRDARIVEKSFLTAYRDLPKASVDLLVTSPPYLNNYHYNRNTRPHLYWLGFCQSPADLKRLENLNFGTYWQNARERKRVVLESAAAAEEIQDVLEDVRKQNPGKGHLWRPRLGQLRGTLLQRLREVRPRRQVVPSARSHGIGGNRQQHPTGRTHPDGPLSRRYRGALRPAIRSHSYATRRPRRKQHRQLERSRRNRRQQATL